jgi:hypothetical protein
VVKVADGKFALQANKKWYEVPHKYRNLPKQKLQQHFEAGNFKPVKEDKPE